MTAEVKQALIDQARAEYGDIEPCYRKTLDECFTEYGSRMMFWFNAPDKSTRVVSVKLNSRRDHV